jgi:catalase
MTIPTADTVAGIGIPDRVLVHDVTDFIREAEDDLSFHHSRRSRTAEAVWHADGEMVHTAPTLRVDDDDWAQAAALVREVMDDAERERLVSNVAGHLRNGVSEKVLQRAFEYWKSIDKEVGARIEDAVRTAPPNRSHTTEWRARPELQARQATS